MDPGWIQSSWGFLKSLFAFLLLSIIVLGIFGMLYQDIGKQQKGPDSREQCRQLIVPMLQSFFVSAAY